MVSGRLEVLLDEADPDVLRPLFGKAPLTDADALKAALTSQAGSLDPQVRRAAVTDAQRYLVQDAHVIPVNEQALVLGVSEKVHGLSFTAISGASFYDDGDGRASRAHRGCPPDAPAQMLHPARLRASSHSAGRFEHFVHRLERSLPLAADCVQVSCIGDSDRR